MGVKAKGILRYTRVDQVTSASLRYPLSVFNKNSTLKGTNMKAWLATARSGDLGKTQPPEAAREEEVRQQATNTASWYFTDLWRLNEQKKRGAPSKEFAERERARSTLVVAYMTGGRGGGRSGSPGGPCGCY